jgi:hypothetical protein
LIKIGNGKLFLREIGITKEKSLIPSIKQGILRHEIFPFSVEREKLNCSLSERENLRVWN